MPPEADMNFSLVGADFYGDDKYERLRALKREWDPDNVTLYWVDAQ